MSSRVVVRGAGSIGQRHAEVFRSLGADVRIWPVRGRGGLGARYLDDRSGSRALTAADLVVIATDTSRHRADAIEALDAGAVSVLVEKPVSPSAEDAQVLIAHPRSDRVWVAAPLRAHRAYRHLRAMLVDEAADPPASAHLWAQSWLPDWRPGTDYLQSYSARLREGGVLRDMIHEIDYATVLLGAPDLLAAHLEFDGPLPIEAEQAATLLWRTPTTTVTCRLDYVTRPASRGLVLNGRSGSVSWDVIAGTLGQTSPGCRPVVRAYVEDLDRGQVMGTQARATLTLSPGDPIEVRISAGAPATLLEGTAAIDLCDRARTLSAVRRAAHRDVGKEPGP